jgi:hypothetical protein
MAQWYHDHMDDTRTANTLRTYVSVAWNVHHEALDFVAAKFQHTVVSVCLTVCMSVCVHGKNMEKSVMTSRVDDYL